jgi:hypothetical protein
MWSFEWGGYLTESGANKTMCTSISLSVFLAAGSIFIGMPSASSAFANSDTDARMILDGVRASRLALREGTVTIQITRELKRLGKTESYSIRAEWKDDSVRFLESHPDGTFRRCSIRHDGELLFRQENYGGADYGGGLKDLITYPYFLFDPRILGASPWFSPIQTADFVLFPATSEWEALLLDDSDHIDDFDCFVIRWQTYGFRQDYWIDVANGFRVRKIVDYNNNSEYLSVYSEDCVLPHTVTRTNRDRKTQAVTSKTVFELSELELSPVEDSIFSLAGLGLEVGEPVIDERLQQRIGFWNGRDLSESRAEAFAVALSREPEPRRPRRWLAFSIGAFVLLVVGIILQRVALVRSTGRVKDKVIRGDQGNE